MTIEDVKKIIPADELRILELKKKFCWVEG